MVTVHDYLAPWMRHRGVNVPTNPVQVQPARTCTGQAATSRYLLQNDPSYCCEACEELTALIGVLRDGPELDAAVAAHGCERSPITASEVTR